MIALHNRSVEQLREIVKERTTLHQEDAAIGKKLHDLGFKFAYEDLNQI